MKKLFKAVPWIFATTILLVCCSCSTQKHITQTVRDVQKDTVYLSNIQYDSIYISQDKLIDRSKDTSLYKRRVGGISLQAPA